MTVCDCCGRDEKACDIRVPLIGWRETFRLPEHFCSDCLATWYDTGVTDPAEIKRRVLVKSAAGSGPTGLEPK